jgi:hypothetical protein
MQNNFTTRTHRVFTKWGMAILSTALFCAATSGGAAASPPIPNAAIPITGVCTFGTGASNALQADFSPSLGADSGGITGVHGQGNCTSNAGTTVMTLSVSLTGLWTCNGGLATGVADIVWSTITPQSQSGLSAVATGGPATVHLILRDPALHFAASGDFVWKDPTAVALCDVNGETSIQLTGALAFVAD